VRESAVNRQSETATDDVDSQDELVARIAADRRAGKDATKDVEALLRRAGKENKAALDRLAK
jgi:hypothetical protein